MNGDLAGISPIIIGGVVEAVTKIISRHFDQTGEILTDAAVKEQLRAEIASGQSEIAAWFREHNLPVPE